MVIANQLAEIVSDIIILAVHLGLDVFVEQPSSSLFGRYPTIAHTLKMVKAKKVTWRMGDFGGLTPKPQAGYTTARWSQQFLQIAKIARKLTPGTHRRICTFYGVKKWTASKQALNASAIYPVRFCTALLQLHMHGAKVWPRSLRSAQPIVLDP